MGFKCVVTIQPYNPFTIYFCVRYNIPVTYTLVRKTQYAFLLIVHVTPTITLLHLITFYSFIALIYTHEPLVIYKCTDVCVCNGGKV